eukprot:11185988-Lingulodinium_polyedra.AAC.1
MQDLPRATETVHVGGLVGFNVLRQRVFELRSAQETRYPLDHRRGVGLIVEPPRAISITEISRPRNAPIFRVPPGVSLARRGHSRLRRPLRRRARFRGS